MSLGWKTRLKHMVPPRLLNATLLRFPFLYGTPWVRYETNLMDDGGVEDLLEQLDLALAVPGDVIECGSSRCGGSVLMARRLRERGERRRIFACDSFEGFDRDELRAERVAGLTNASDQAFTSTSFDYVTRKLARLGHADVVVPVRGYFQQTLPTLQGPWCMGLIDCDLENSMVYCAEQIWPQLSPGGRLLFDDYACDDFAGARRGVERFLERFGAEIEQHGLERRLYVAVKARTASVAPVAG